ncbi:MAG: GTP cyclohydrolase I [Deltaproteobacteria bacterium]|nr:MAG: GTP cyclohydrolase I [Deltaproteobacteria bacterium]
MYVLPIDGRVNLLRSLQTSPGLLLRFPLRRGDEQMSDTRPKDPTETPSPLRFDEAEMAEGIRRFLEGIGIGATGECRNTPQRVARVWKEEFLDGYTMRPEEILAEAMPSETKSLIVVRDIAFHAICPHHLLPYSGVTHLAYLPEGKISGFSHLVRLVECFTHRLALQEEITRQIPEALIRFLGARGAACIMIAVQQCMTITGPVSRGSRVVTSSLQGAFEKDSSLREELFFALQGRAQPQGTPTMPSGLGQHLP